MSQIDAKMKILSAWCYSRGSWIFPLGSPVSSYFPKKPTGVRLVAAFIAVMTRIKLLLRMN